MLAITLEWNSALNRAKEKPSMPGTHLIPLALKLAYSLFVVVLVPYYWMTYSAWNFLFFCDFALLLGLVALWLESPLLMSLAAVGITLPQLLWVFDLLTGARITGMTSYMFNAKLPIFVRACHRFTAGCRSF